MAAHTEDDYLKNEEWVTRIKASFDIIDINKNGYVEEDDWRRWVENIKREVNPEAKLLENLNQAMTNYIKAFGGEPGKKFNKDEYVKLMAKLGAIETTRRSKGEKTLGEDLNNAWYDIVDKNHDGCVTMDEFKAIMKACNIGEAMAEQRFNAIDKNKNGKVERSELSEFQFKFWFILPEK